MSEKATKISVPTPSRPGLDALLEKARHYVMTPAEKREQRRSWVRGEMMLEHPEMTRDYVDRLLDEAGI